MFPSPQTAAFPQQLLSKPAKGAQPPTPGCAGSPSPGWQSGCYASDPDQCPDCRDRYHKTQQHEQTHGTAEDCLACWLPPPKSIFPRFRKRPWLPCLPKAPLAEPGALAQPW